MTREEAAAKLLALHEEEAFLRHASARDAAETEDASRIASRKAREARLAAISAERDALELPPGEEPRPNVSAVVQLQRTACSTGMALFGQVHIVNHGFGSVRVVQLQPVVLPRAAGIVPPDWRPSVGPEVPGGGGSLWLPFEVRFIHPQSGPAVTASIGALVTLEGGAQVEAEAADILVHPPA